MTPGWCRPYSHLICLASDGCRADISPSSFLCYIGICSHLHYHGRVFTFTCIMNICPICPMYWNTSIINTCTDAFVPCIMLTPGWCRPYSHLNCYCQMDIGLTSAQVVFYATLGYVHIYMYHGHVFTFTCIMNMCPSWPKYWNTSIINTYVHFCKYHEHVSRMCKMYWNTSLINTSLILTKSLHFRFSSWKK